MRFVTAAYGAEYVRAATALRRSFDVAMPDAELLIYSDDPNVSSPGCCIQMDELLEPTLPFNPIGGRRCCVFSFVLLKWLTEEHGEDACWIDADMIVLGDMDSQFKVGVPNFICHGRRGGPRLPIGGMFSLPPGPIADHLIGKVRERRDNNRSGDMIVIQRYTLTSPPSHWLTDDKTRIYNMELGRGLHPRVGDPNLKRISRGANETWYLDDRQIMLVCFTMHRLREHLADNFQSFAPAIGDFLRSSYEVGTHPKG